MLSFGRIALYEVCGLHSDVTAIAWCTFTPDDYLCMFMCLHFREFTESIFGEEFGGILLTAGRENVQTAPFYDHLTLTNILSYP